MVSIRRLSVQFDFGYQRLAAWVGLSILLVLTLYNEQFVGFVSGLDNLLLSRLGSGFPAYPFLALLILLTGFKVRDFHRLLLAERGLASRPSVRLLGLMLILSPAILSRIIPNLGGPSSYTGLEFSAVSFVLVAFRSKLALNPIMARTVTPYDLLFVAGLVSPLVLNSARIATTIWFGFQGGTSVFWGVHDWIGYIFFLAFYLTILAFYAKPSRAPTAAKTIASLTPQRR